MVSLSIFRWQVPLYFPLLYPVYHTCNFLESRQQFLATKFDLIDDLNNRPNHHLLSVFERAVLTMFTKKKEEKGMCTCICLWCILILWVRYYLLLASLPSLINRGHAQGCEETAWALLYQHTHYRSLNPEHSAQIWKYLSWVHTINWSMSFKSGRVQL